MKLGRIQRTGRPSGVDSGLEKSFGGIDVPDAGDPGLVEKSHFDGLLGTPQSGVERVRPGGGIQGFRANVLKRLVPKGKPSKVAGVFKGQVEIRKMEDDRRVLRKRSVPI